MKLKSTFNLPSSFLMSFVLMAMTQISYAHLADEANNVNQSTLRQIHWENSGFKLNQSLVFQSDVTSSERHLDLNILILEDSGWNEVNVRSLVQEAADVYSQCGIELKNVHLFFVRAKSGILDYAEFAKEGADSILALRRATPEELSGLTIYLFRSISDRPGSAGFSRAKWNQDFEVDKNLYDTIFLTHVANSKEYQEERKASPYNLLAHEMLHVLTRIGGHFNSIPKNLLNIWSTRSNLILKPHCEEALKNPLLY